MNQITLPTFLLLLIPLIQIKAQTIVGNHFITSVTDVRVYHTNSQYDTLGKDRYTFVKKGVKFTVIDINAKAAIIEFWNYDSTFKQSTEKTNTETLQTSLNTLKDKHTAIVKAEQIAFQKLDKAYSLEQNKEKLTTLNAELDSVSALIDAAKDTVQHLEARVQYTVERLAAINADPNDRRDAIYVKGDKFDYSTLGAYVDGRANGRQFIIELSDLDSKCTPYNGNANDFTWGAVTVPIKMRFGDGDRRQFSFEASANLGLFAGYKRQIRGVKLQSLNFLFGTSIASVSYEPEDFLIRSGAWKDTTGKFSGTSLALSTNVGIVYQIESFQIGVFTGLDFIPRELGKGWTHQGMPWFGVGIGFGLFAKDKKGGKAENSNK